MNLMSSRTRSKLLSTLLAFAMLLSLLPTAAFAAGETGTYSKVTENQDDWTGEYLLVYEGNSIPYVFNGSLSKLDAVNNYVEVPAEGNSITTQRGYAITVEAVADGYVIKAANGEYIYAPSDAKNLISASDNKDTAAQYPITFTSTEDGVDIALRSGPHMRFNANGDQMRFRYYKSGTYTDQQPVTLYKLEGEGGGEVTPPGPEEPETITIAEALAKPDGTENLAVTGVVTLLDGKNVYLQDSTGGICVRMSSNFDDISLGDTIIGTGKRATFNGLPQLENSTYEKSSGLTLTPTVKTIRELTDADICTYVTIQNVQVTEVFDNNGQYSNPNITVKDAGGNTIQLYKAVVEKNVDGSWPVAVDDTITITAAVSVYNGTLRLRNTNASEIDLDGTPAGPIAHGDQVVIYNPAFGKALSGEYNGYYNKGTEVSVADGILRGFTTADVWTVSDNGNGTWSFSYNEKNIGMGDDFSSMPLGEKNDQWVLEDAGNGLFYIKNTARNAYMEWYAEKGNWSGFEHINEGTESLFALAFYKVTEIPEEPTGELPKEGEQVVIYNLSSQGVLAGQSDNNDVQNAPAALTDGVVTPANGARVFTVEKNGTYYRFKTAHDGYLCSNGTGNNAFYSQTASEDADWTLTVGKKGGWNLESRTAKFNGQYSQFLEYFGGSYKTYSMNKVTDYDIFEFCFYPVADNGNVTDGVVNLPSVTFGTLNPAYVGQDYTVTFTVDAVFGVAEISAKYGEADVTPTLENGAYSFTIPASALREGEMTITVTGTDTKGAAFNGTATVQVLDEPIISAVFPAPNIQTGDEKQPEIGFTFANAGDEPSVTLTVNGQDVTPTVENGKASYTPTEALADGKVTVTATVTRADKKTVSRTWNFTVGTAQYQLYFGQLHSHTAEYSDGAGTLQEGLNYVANLPESANVDFVAFTDHSNYFDTSSEANPEAALYDVSQMSGQSTQKWNAYKGAVAAFNEQYAGERVALAGFEMTWSGGPGHINTFNTPGIVSRNNTTLNNKTEDKGLQAYYALLSNEKLVNSISQFNHPGTTFGNFIDFGYYSPIIDSRMYLVEVGNGEGAIGAGGYYPSYDQYIMALDKGWHLAPTNNQDNHKGKWGNANDARDVVLTDNFSEEGIYEAIRNYRVYATEDKNLEIRYTLNGQMLGSVIPDADRADIRVSVFDPDGTDSISKVEVVVNSGAVAYTWDDPAELSTGELECSLSADYNYYFIRVTQGDGDIAVTAPVWIGEVVKLGISSVECGTSTPVTDEELTLTTTLFNSEAEPATVKSITYTNGSEVLGTDDTGYTLPASGTLNVEWKYTPTVAKVMSITVTATIVKGDLEYTYSKDVTLDVGDADRLVYIGIDASHYNEYVNGNYKDSMGNFGNLAAGYSVRTVQLNTSAELIAACKNESGKYVGLVLTAPSRRDGDKLRDPYLCYTEDELDAIAAFNAAGGAVIVAGWGDYYESYASFPAGDHMAAQQNKVLEALGSSLRVSDDELKDDVYNGGQPQRLYLSSYNFDSFLLNRVEFDADNPHNNLYTELFSQYGGASIHVVDASGQPTSTIPDTVTPVVYAFDTSYSEDDDKDNYGDLGKIPTYAYAEGDNRLMVLATEQLEGKGLIVVSGAAFLSNFEVQAEVGDSGSEKNYSNYKICENLVNYLNPATISKIADVQAQKDEGVKYTVEGVVTSNASGYDKTTAFFDCIYLQDDSAGINAFPVAGNYKVGDKVRVTGTTSSYQGERQLNVTSIEKIGEEKAPEPKHITTKEAAQSTYLGSLVQIDGVVVSFAEAEGLVQTIIVRDQTGYDARVFIDGYITSNKTIENLAVGHKITVTGLSSYDTSFDGPAARIRVRDRADIVCGTEVVDIPPAHVDPEEPVIPPYTPGDDDDDDEIIVIVNGGSGTNITDPDTPLGPGVFTDVDRNAWYYADVNAMVEQGLLVGVSNDRFAPDWTVSRAMLASVLYRMSDETYTGSSSFQDVPSGAWYSDAVAWASTNSVVYGYSDTRFGPNDNVTREQLVTMLYRYQQLLGKDVSQKGDLSAFSDAGQVSAFAQDAMAWAVAEGIIQGRSGSLLAPTGTASRAELCSILVRFQALNA